MTVCKREPANEMRRDNCHSCLFFSSCKLPLDEEEQNDGEILSLGRTLICQAGGYLSTNPGSLPVKSCGTKLMCNNYRRDYF